MGTDDVRTRRALPAPGALAPPGALALPLASGLGTDYDADTRPAIDALLAGDGDAFFAQAPSMGPLSLVLRAPAALVADALGGGTLAVYRAGAVVCLAVLALLLVLVARDLLARRPGPTVAPGTVLLLVAVLALNPVTLRALELGHPEEPLGAALCAGALLLAARGAPRAAGVVLGLALATKPWALLAVVPVALVLPATRAALTALLVPAACVPIVLTLPWLVADAGAFLAAFDRPVGGLGEMRPGNLWRPLVSEERVLPLGGGETATLRLVPGWLQSAAHPATALVLLGAPAVWWWRRARSGRGPLTLERGLALLALVMLARCVVDPWNHEYYHLPFLVSLGLLETVARGRPPVVTALATAVLWVLFARAATPTVGAWMDVAYLVWALPTAAWVTALLAGHVPARATAIIGVWTRTPPPDPSPVA